MKIKLLLTVLSGWFLSGFCSPAYAGSCGAVNQRPCTIFERIPSCDKGLYENFRLGKCLRPKPPKPRKLYCGAVNQKPCKIWERIPSCNKGLIENFAKNRCERPKALVCGRINQKPCKLWERVPSCNKGLVENFAKGKCLQGAHHREYQIANKKLAEISGVVAQYLDMATGFSNNMALLNALHSNNQQAVVNVLRKRFAPRAVPLPGGEKIRTISAGIGSNVKIIVGGSSSAGVALDLNGKLPPYAYSSADYGVSLGIAGGADLDLGFWVCQANKIGGDVWGIEMGVGDIIQFGKVVKGATKFADAIKPGADIGITLWFSYPKEGNKFQGFTITPSIGAGLDFGGYIKGRTVVQNDPSVNCQGRKKKRR